MAATADRAIKLHSANPRGGYEVIPPPDPLLQVAVGPPRTARDQPALSDFPAPLSQLPPGLARLRLVSSSPSSARDVHHSILTPSCYHHSTLVNSAQTISRSRAGLGRPLLSKAPNLRFSYSSIALILCVQSPHLASSAKVVEPTTVTNQGIPLQLGSSPLLTALWPFFPRSQHVSSLKKPKSRVRD